LNYRPNGYCEIFEFGHCEKKINYYCYEVTPSEFCAAFTFLPPKRASGASKWAMEKEEHKTVSEIWLHRKPYMLKAEKAEHTLYSISFII
jgi:hypothetical protein